MKNFLIILLLLIAGSALASGEWPDSVDYWGGRFKVYPPEKGKVSLVNKYNTYNLKYYPEGDTGLYGELNRGEGV